MNCSNLRCFRHMSDKISDLNTTLLDWFMQALEETPKVDEVANDLEATLEVTTRVTKAQKRRDKKQIKDRERDLAVAEQEQANLQGARHLETESIRKLLASRGLTFHDVPSDGHW